MTWIWKCPDCGTEGTVLHDPEDDWRHVRVKCESCGRVLRKQEALDYCSIKGGGDVPGSTTPSKAAVEVSPLTEDVREGRVKMRCVVCNSPFDYHPGPDYVDYDRKIRRTAYACFGVAALAFLIWMVAMFVAIFDDPENSMLFVSGFAVIIFCWAMSSVYGRAKRRLLDEKFAYETDHPPSCPSCSSSGQQRERLRDRLEEKYDKEVEIADDYSTALGRGLTGLFWFGIAIVIFGGCVLSGIAALAYWDTNRELSAILAVPPILLFLYMVKPERSRKSSTSGGELPLHVKWYVSRKYYEKWKKKFG